MTLRTALAQGTELLADSAICAPRLTAEVLLMHALHQERAFLYGHPEYELREVEWIHYGRYLHERLNGKPTQYITGRQEFYGREFRVTPDVLIPRPETEHAVEAALSLEPRPRRIVDAGCGSGAIGVTLQLEMGAEVWATDISAAAVAVASRNGAALGAHVQFVVCDLVSAIAVGSMDLVVSNPPYVPNESHLPREVREHEPAVALYGGATGFEIYERLIPEVARVLRPGGSLIMEIGFTAAERIAEMLQGWRDVRFTLDLAGIPRVVSCERRG